MARKSGPIGGRDGIVKLLAAADGVAGAKGRADLKIVVAVGLHPLQAARYPVDAVRVYRRAPVLGLRRLWLGRRLGGQLGGECGNGELASGGSPGGLSIGLIRLGGIVGGLVDAISGVPFEEQKYEQRGDLRRRPVSWAEFLQIGASFGAAAGGWSEGEPRLTYGQDQAEDRG